MSVNDGVLFGADGQPAGRYEADFIESHAVMPGPEGKPGLWRSWIRRDGDHPVFDASLSLADQNTPMFIFAGVLRRAR